MKIPRILHGIWFGSELPEQLQEYRGTWETHHHDWEFILWDNDNLFELENQKLFDKARTPAEQSDIARYEILKRFGGVYADMDFECYQNIEPLLGYHSFFIVMDKPVWKGSVPKYNIPYLNNALMGCIPDHPLINRLINRLPSFVKENRDEHVCFRTGPGFVSQTLYDERDVLLLDNYKLRKEGYTRHHYMNSWKETEPQPQPWPKR